MKTVTAYDRPREKLRGRGAASLTSVELLQIIIGSGNAEASVARIAKRSVRLLSKQNNELSYDQLLAIKGLGPATASQIIAAFELASRYPMSSRRLVIYGDEKASELFSSLRESTARRLAYVTVDGARRVISRREIIMDDATYPTTFLRKVFRDVTADNASGLIVAVGSRDYHLVPGMFDLSFARDLRSMAQLFLVKIHDCLLVNQQGEESLIKEG